MREAAVMPWRRAILTIVAVLVLPPAASANSYDVFACGNAPAGVNNSWTNRTTQPAYVNVAASCAVGLTATDNLAAPGFAPADSSAHWEFEAPPGTAIASLRYSAYLGKDGDNDWQVFGRTAEGRVFATCDIPASELQCSTGDSQYTPGMDRLAGDLATAGLDIGFVCKPTDGAATCAVGSNRHRVWVTLYAATVTLTDGSTPALTRTGGQLSAGEYIRDHEPATFTASDNTGIRAARIYVDGVLHTTTTYACDFTYAVPCSNKSDAEVSLDTRSLGDGAHDVQLGVVDPAGNETRSDVHAVVVDNSAPGTPQGLAVDGGPDWRDTNSFDVSWSNPVDSGAPVSAVHYALCSVDGSGCQPAQQVTGADVSHIAGIAVPSAGEWGLRVWLEDAAGNVDPANAAEVSLRFGSTSSVLDPAPAEDTPSEPTPQLSDQLSRPAAELLLGPPLAPVAVAIPRRDPRLRLSRSTRADGRVVLRGRVSPGVTGSLSLTVRSPHARTVRRHVAIRGGRFTVVLRARRGSVLARFGGTSAFKPARATLRF